MSHETILYGYIAGISAVNSIAFHSELQERNRKIVEALPKKDEYPYMSRNMFTIPQAEDIQTTFRTQIFHFGASMKYLEEEEIPVWIGKFEQLLKSLYWVSAIVHINTEFLGHFAYKYTADHSFFEFLWAGNPQSTLLWQREIMCDGIAIVSTDPKWAFLAK